MPIRSPQSVRNWQQPAAGRAIFAAGDLTKREGTEAMVAAALAEFGAVDILINNAGMQHVAPVRGVPGRQVDAIIALNLTSAFDACRPVHSGDEGKGWGRILFTASAHSLTASPFKAAYVSG